MPATPATITTATYGGKKSDRSRSFLLLIPHPPIDMRVHPAVELVVLRTTLWYRFHVFRALYLFHLQMLLMP